jgi:polar amino acid transport system substrate-binding protein
VTRDTAIRDTALKRLLTAGILCFLPIGLAAAAVEPKPEAQAPLRVGVTPSLPPMIFRQGKAVVGVEADLAEALGRELNRSIRFVELDWEDLLDGLLNDRIDIIMSSMSITAARQARIAFTNPYLQVGQMGLARANEQYRFALGFSAPEKMKIGVKKGSTGDILVQQQFPRVRRKTFSSVDDAAKALVKKNIDLFISDSTVIYWLSGAYENQGLSVAPMVFSEEFLGWGVRKSDAALLASANAFLEKVRQNGELTRVLKRWMPGSK